MMLIVKYWVVNIILTDTDCMDTASAATGEVEV